MIGSNDSVRLFERLQKTRAQCHDDDGTHEHEGPVGAQLKAFSLVWISE